MTTIQRRSIGVIGVALAFVLASCAESESGTPTNTPPSTNLVPPSTAETETSTSIQNPIDTTRLLDQPCEALHEDDREPLNLIDGRIETDTASQAADACIWERSEDSGSHVDLIVMTENANGLQDIRERNQDSELYEELRIGGYPALHASPTDLQDEGRCDLWIGANDSEVLYLYATLRDVPEASDPCGYTDEVGEAIIANLSS